MGPPNSRNYLLIISRERLDTLAFWGEVPAEASPFKLVCTYIHTCTRGGSRLGGGNKFAISSFLLLVSFCVYATTVLNYKKKKKSAAMVVTR